MKPAGLAGREDLRDLPLVTIDPADARDHDDAVLPIPTTTRRTRAASSSGSPSPTSRITSRPGSALDREARKRGNSTYFPDRVVPMLPDRLSGDLCSLHEGVARAVHRRADEDRRATGSKIVAPLHPRADALAPPR